MMMIKTAHEECEGEPNTENYRCNWKLIATLSKASGWHPW
jgi:hypothetical protein